MSSFRAPMMTMTVIRHSASRCSQSSQWLFCHASVQPSRPGQQQRQLWLRQFGSGQHGHSLFLRSSCRSVVEVGGAGDGLILYRYSSSASAKPLPKKFHAGLQEGLLSSSSSSTTSTAFNTSVSQATAAVALERQRQERYRTAGRHIGVSFVVLLLAAQSFKASVERKHAETKRSEAEEITEHTRALLRAVTSEETVHRLAQEVCRAVHEENVSATAAASSWSRLPFGRSRSDNSSSSSVLSDLDDEPKTARVRSLLHKHYSRIVGLEHLDETERDQIRVQELLTDAGVLSSNSDNDSSDISETTTSATGVPSMDDDSDLALQELLSQVLLEEEAAATAVEQEGSSGATKKVTRLFSM